MTKVEFIDEFSKKYQDWAVQNNCGATDTGRILDIAIDLKVATNLQVYRSVGRVRGHIDRKESNVILFLSDKRPPKSGAGDWEEFCHCRLVASRTATDWNVEEVDDSIANCNPITISDSDLDKWAAYFCVFSFVK
jgi:hypothetical protein